MHVPLLSIIILLIFMILQIGIQSSINCLYKLNVNNTCIIVNKSLFNHVFIDSGWFGLSGVDRNCFGLLRVDLDGFGWICGFARLVADGIYEMCGYREGNFGMLQ